MFYNAYVVRRNMLFVILCENKGQLPLQKSSITMLDKFSNMFTLFTYSNKTCILLWLLHTLLCVLYTRSTL